MNRWITTFLLAVFFAAQNAVAQATTIVETESAWDGQYSLGNLFLGKVWGQTFMAPGKASELTDATFWLQPIPIGSPYPSTFTFDITAYLAPWDGEKAQSPFVADSTSTVTVTPLKMNRFTFEFDSASLAANEPYVLFFQIAQTAPIWHANFGYVVGNVYPSGQFVGPYAGSFNNVTNRSWTMFPDGDDFAFELRFAAVPETSSFVLGLIGMTCACIVCRKRCTRLRTQLQG